MRGSIVIAAILITACSSVEGIKWLKMPGTVNESLCSQAWLEWVYELNASDANPPALRWYEVPSEPIAVYIFSDDSFSAIGRYNVSGKLEYNGTAIAPNKSATLVINNLEPLDFTDFYVSVQSVGSNYNANIKEYLDLYLVVTIDGVEVDVDNDFYMNVVSFDNITVTLRQRGCEKTTIVADISITYQAEEASDVIEIAKCSGVNVCSGGPVDSEVAIEVSVEVRTSQTSIDTFFVYPVFTEGDPVYSETATEGSDVTLSWLYNEESVNLTSLQWYQDIELIASYTFRATQSTTRGRRTNNGEYWRSRDNLEFNEATADSDASLTVTEVGKSDAGAYKVVLAESGGGKFTSNEITVEVEESGLTKEQKIAIGVGIGVGVPVLVLIIVLPITLCKPKSKATD